MAVGSVGRDAEDVDPAVLERAEGVVELTSLLRAAGGV